MARLFDRVKDTTTSTGPTSFTVSGSAPTGYQTFSARFAVGDSGIPVTIASQTLNTWQTCYCTYSATNTLTVDQVLYSSNSDAAVTFGGETKDIFVSFVTVVSERRGKVTMERMGGALPG